MADTNHQKILNSPNLSVRILRISVSGPVLRNCVTVTVNARQAFTLGQMPAGKPARLPKHPADRWGWNSVSEILLSSSPTA